MSKTQKTIGSRWVVTDMEFTKPENKSIDDKSPSVDYGKKNGV